ncbi:hypothetical protein QR680_012015 [Steinernema hermaphroditum]|uniref:Uncharacterized protein n=1 Tax=Steinernema hermaphroditum TaxID=289476 RepID=A0AA39I329_9BILA|nr:hypothetical protein QR680_012015 [Steinernema hermaphroditum]
MIADRFIVVAIVALLFSCSNAETTKNPWPDKVLTFVSYDHQGDYTLNITSVGQFYRFSAVKKAIEKIIDAHADWCGFGQQLVAADIPSKWSESNRTEFNRMLVEFSCVERAKQGIVRSVSDTDDDKEKSKEFTKTERTAYTVASVVLLFAIVSAILVLIIIFIVKCCGRSSATDSSCSDREDRSVNKLEFND